MSRNSGFGAYHVSQWRRSYPNHSGLLKLARDFKMQEYVKERDNLEKKLLEGGEILGRRGRSFWSPLSARAIQRMEDKLIILQRITQ